MINILLEGYDIDASWLYNELKRYLCSSQKVAVVPFSFRDNRVKNATDWDALYSMENGKFYQGIVNSFNSYGIEENNISFLNYFTDSKQSAAELIRQSDVIYFLGGLPDRMMERLEEFDLLDLLAHHQGVIIGYSAGAVIQLSEYHLSPDEDYPTFGYYKGIPYLKDFYLQVHYEGTDEQNFSIRRVIDERSKPVYATHYRQGAIVINRDNGQITLLGKVSVFQ